MDVLIFSKHHNSSIYIYLFEIFIYIFFSIYCQNNCYQILPRFFYNIQQFDFEHLIALMQQDKKNENAAINFSLLPKIGSVEVNCTADSELIKESLTFYATMH